MIDTDAWSGLVLLEPVTEGNRNEVWQGEYEGQLVAVRQSRRTAASLAWELDLLAHLRSLKFAVPAVIASDDGPPSVAGVVVQRWIPGQPPVTASDWRAVAAELSRLHRATKDYPQRPGCCPTADLRSARRSVDADLDAMPADVQDLVTAVFAEFGHLPTSVIHGDPTPSNLRITADGDVGLLDWDESRVDVAYHDLSNLGVSVLDPDQQRQAERLSNAWEAVNGWVAEPEYARRRLDAL